MTATLDGKQVYVMPVGRVRESIYELLSRNTHPYFIAYLYLRSLQGSASTLAPLTPDWTELSKLLEVPGAPPSKPHLRPFWKGERNAGQEWLNKNLAGSFAPSSLRDIPARVVKTDAQGRFILRKDHWELALKHLLFDVPLPALAVASFMFRDYGFVASSLPDRDDLVQAFRRKYGYADENEFNRLYDTKWSGKAGPWFHPATEEIVS